MGIPEPESALLRRFRISRPVSGWRDEMDLQARIGAALSAAGHAVYYAHADAAQRVHGNALSFSGTSCLVDLLVATHERWGAHEDMPSVGVEVKLAKNLGWLREGAQQTARYARTAEGTRFSHHGATLPQPTQFLLATDDSWATGHLYRWWNEARFAPRSDCEALAAMHGCSIDDARYFLMERAWRGATETWRSVLLQDGIALMSGPDGAFATNRFGPLRTYRLIDHWPRLADPPRELSDEDAYGRKLRDLLGGGAADGVD